MTKNNLSIVLMLTNINYTLEYE